MFIDKYTSTKEIVNNLFRDTDRTETINYADAAYWIYECMELINYPMTYIPKVMGHKGEESYDLENYKAELPDDFHRLIAVALDGIICIPSQNNFHHLMDGSCCDWSNDSFPSEYFYDNFGNTFSPQALPLNRKVADRPPTFTISDHFITFDRREGKVCLVYWAFPLDKEGFPLIPDDVKYKRACSNYLGWKYDRIAWRKGLIPRDVFLESQDEKDWAIASCQSNLKMPDVNQMESIRRQVTKMIVRTDDFKSAFNFMNNRGIRGRY